MPEEEKELETPNVGADIAQRVEEIKTEAKSPASNPVAGKRMVIALFVAAGAFFAFVLWRQHQASTATATATGQIQDDAVQAGQQADLDTQLAAIGQAVSSGNAQIAAQLNSVNSNVSGARTDASIAANYANQQSGSKKTPAPVQVTHKPAPPAPPKRRPIAAHPADKYGHVNSL